MRFFLGKIALTTVQIALGFASCNFPVAMQFFPKSHSHPCDYLYKSIPRIPSIAIRKNRGLTELFAEMRVTNLGCTGSDVMAFSSPIEICIDI